MIAINSIKNKIFCPLLTAIVQICIIYTLFFHFFSIQNHYKTSISNSRIKERIDNRIAICGKDYWISWMVLDANDNKNRYFFQDVIGCNPLKQGNCAFSVKDMKLNKFYNEEYHKVDDKTYEFLMKMDTGVAGYYEDVNFIKQFPSIYEVIKHSNKTINSIGISVTKDLRKNIVYVFSMTKTSKTNNSCSKQDVINTLEDLSIFAKENL